MRTRFNFFGVAAGLGLLLTATAAFPLSPAGEGRRVYLSQNCYGCHGGRAGGGMGPNFRDNVPAPADVTAAVLGLSGGMPPYPGLTSTDISNLSAYFQSLRTAGEPTFTRWWEAVPTQ